MTDLRKRSPGLTLAGVALTAIPFVFGSIRFAETGTDTRYLWIAFVSTLAAFVLNKWAPGTWRGRVAASFVMSAVSTAAVAAIFLGVRPGPGMAVVASAFAVCSATGLALLLWRPRT